MVKNLIFRFICIEKILIEGGYSLKWISVFLDISFWFLSFDWDIKFTKNMETSTIK